MREGRGKKMPKEKAPTVLADGVGAQAQVHDATSASATQEPEDISTILTHFVYDPSEDPTMPDEDELAASDKKDSGPKSLRSTPTKSTEDPYRVLTPQEAGPFVPSDMSVIDWSQFERGGHGSKFVIKLDPPIAEISDIYGLDMALTVETRTTNVNTVFDVRDEVVADYTQTDEFIEELREALIRCMMTSDKLDPVAQCVFFTPHYSRPMVLSASNEGMSQQGYLGMIATNVHELGTLPIVAPKHPLRTHSRIPPMAVAQEIFSSFTEVDAERVARALDIVRYSEFSDGRHDPASDQYLWRDETGAYVPLFDERLKDLFCSTRTRMSDRAYPAAMRAVRTAARDVHRLDTRHYLAIEGGSRVINLDLDPSDPNFVSEPPANTISMTALPHTFDNDLFDEDGERFLDNIANHDPETRRYIEEIGGTCITPELTRVGFLTGALDGTDDDLIGREKANGKSAFFNVVRGVVGEYNVAELAMNDLDGEYDRAELRDKLVNFDSDRSSELIGKAVTSIIKKATGRDALRSNRKYKDAITFRNTATFLIATNNIPRFTMSDLESGALDRRVEFVPFLNYFGPGSADADEELLIRVLASKKSLTYIFSCFVRGLLRINKRGGKLKPTSYATDLHAMLTAEGDPVARWLVNSDVPLTRNMLLGLESCPALDTVLVKEYERFRHRMHSTDGVCSDITAAWYQVYKTWHDEYERGSSVVSMATFTKSVKRLLGFSRDAYPTSWTWAHGTKRDKVQGYRFVSLPDGVWQKQATGLSLPAGDRIAEKAKAVAESNDIDVSDKLSDASLEVARVKATNHPARRIEKTQEGATIQAFGEFEPTIMAPETEIALAGIAHDAPETPQKVRENVDKLIVAQSALADLLRPQIASPESIPSYLLTEDAVSYMAEAYAMLCVTTTNLPTTRLDNRKILTQISEEAIHHVRQIAQDVASNTDPMAVKVAVSEFASLATEILDAQVARLTELLADATDKSTSELARASFAQWHPSTVSYRQGNECDHMPWRVRDFVRRYVIAEHLLPTVPRISS